MRLGQRYTAGWVMSAAGAIVMDIAGFRVRLTTASEALLRLLAARYCNFLSAAGGTDADFLIEIADAPSPKADLDVRCTGGTWHLSRGDFSATWTPRTGLGQIRQTVNPYSTDSVIRIVQSVRLASARGLLLHASSVIVNGRAFVFAGRSGAGKTTMARLAPSGAVLLTDEISCVRKTDDGWQAYGTPFAGELGRSGAQQSAVLGGIFGLQHGSAHSTRALTPADALRMLMPNVLFFGGGAAAGDAVLDSACDLVSQVPVGVLTFRPEPAVWAAIT
jgi:hypothetical protein